LSDADVQQVAEMFVEETHAALGTTYPVVPDPGPDVARLRFTIISIT